MKTILMVLLIVIFVTGLVACSPAEPSAAPSDQPADKTPLAVASPGTELTTPRTGDQGPTPAAEESRLLTTPPADPVIASLVLELDGAVLALQRTGGLKGIGPAEQVWRLYEDGRVTSSDGTAWDIDPAVVMALTAGIEAQGFFDLEKLYLPADTCCDLVTYVLAMERDGQSHQVIFTEGAEVPVELPEFIQEINDLLMTLYE